MEIRILELAEEAIPNSLELSREKVSKESMKVECHCTGWLLSEDILKDRKIVRIWLNEQADRDDMIIK